MSTKISKILKTEGSLGKVSFEMMLEQSTDYTEKLRPFVTI